MFILNINWDVNKTFIQYNFFCIFQYFTLRDSCDKLTNPPMQHVSTGRPTTRLIDANYDPSELKIKRCTQRFACHNWKHIPSAYLHVKIFPFVFNFAWANTRVVPKPKWLSNHCQACVFRIPLYAKCQREWECLFDALLTEGSKFAFVTIWHNRHERKEGKTDRTCSWNSMKKRELLETLTTNEIFKFLFEVSVEAPRTRRETSVTYG
jgi:hypothetical protein